MAAAKWSRARHLAGLFRIRTRSGGRDTSGPNVPAAQAHSALMLAALMIGHHFSISAL
jgi:hypothetical protein